MLDEAHLKDDLQVARSNCLLVLRLLLACYPTAHSADTCTCEPHQYYSLTGRYLTMCYQKLEIDNTEAHDPLWQFPPDSDVAKMFQYLHPGHDRVYS